MYSVEIKDVFQMAGHVSFGLSIQGEGPAILGCSFRVNGKIIDQPARWVEAPVLLLWQVESERKEIFSERVGEVIFALYSDHTRQERLSDTGWFEWQLLGAGFMDMAKQQSVMKLYGK